nr:hypothetical protein [uncultured Lachnoclostridium sp.]
MRMIIKEIESADKCTYVIGNTDIGCIKGIWNYSELPVLNCSYFFELTIGEIDRNEISIVNKGNFFPSISTDGKQVSFRGICEEIDEIYAVRFAQDWLEMIEVMNNDFTIHKNDVISFSLNCNSISIYPYKYD